MSESKALPLESDLTKTPEQRLRERVQETIKTAGQNLLSQQNADGYWWFTLEANESIGAGFIQLMHFCDLVDENIQSGLAQRMLSEQQPDGSWSLYHKGPGDISATVECYLSLRLAGHAKDHPSLEKAKNFIRQKGGLSQIRVFTRIHLALFGLIDWEYCPHMPLEMIFLPHWAPLSIYNFSSWARASIVPLLILFAEQPVTPIDFDLKELYVEKTAKEREAAFRFHAPSPLSFDFLFIQIDRILKLVAKLPWKPTHNAAMERCIKWTWEHLQKTEDIYPALAYGLMAFKALDYSFESPQIQKPWNALKRFQQSDANQVPSTQHYRTHQQCCISPVWDTPWSCVALSEAGLWQDKHPDFLKTARWLLSKEVRNPNGDWHHKNPQGVPGGWSFEFENEYFPDVDDTVEVLHALSCAALPQKEKDPAIARGIAWTLSMQNDDGGWGAFDKNNDLDLVNKIPFADHSACLDPSTPDITGRVLELLASQGFTQRDKCVQKALQFLKRSQEDFGGWFGRWGVNYIYGTWAVLTGLALLDPEQTEDVEIKKALDWLQSVQHRDGGFGESPQSYAEEKFVPWERSVPSQTAWGLMALVAGGKANTTAARKAAEWLVKNWGTEQWQEPEHTGTGFPGHFYLRYHGYRLFFPLLALARYQKAT